MDFAFPNFTFSQNLTLGFTVLNGNVQCSEVLLRSVESTLLLDQKFKQKKWQNKLRNLRKIRH